MSSHKERRETRLAAGICPYGSCRNQLAAGKSSCQVCLDKVKNRLAELRVKGICPQCYQPTENGKRYCDACILKGQLQRLPEQARAEAAKAWKLFDGHCQCCNSTNPGGLVGWCFDHCHLTGKFRGIICCHCNRGLGAFFDSIKKLKAAITYLGPGL